MKFQVFLGEGGESYPTGPEISGMGSPPTFPAKFPRSYLSGFAGGELSFWLFRGREIALGSSWAAVVQLLFPLGPPFLVSLGPRDGKTAMKCPKIGATSTQEVPEGWH